MDHVVVYKFDNKDDLYKSLGTQPIHNAARVCLINFYETYPNIEFIKADIKILCEEEWSVIIKTLFRCFFEGERDKTIAEALWNNNNNFMEPTFTPRCYPEKDKWYRIPFGIIEKIVENEKKLRAVENELKRLNEEKEMSQKEMSRKEIMESSECNLL